MIIIDGDIDALGIEAEAVEVGEMVAGHIALDFEPSPLAAGIGSIGDGQEDVVVGLQNSFAGVGVLVVVNIDHRGEPVPGARVPDNSGIADGDRMIRVGKIDARIGPELLVGDIEDFGMVPLGVDGEGAVEELDVMVITDGTHGVGGFADGEIVQIEGRNGRGGEVLADDRSCRG